MTMPSPFVGNVHHQHRDTLVDAFERTRHEGWSRLIVLDGVPGRGKTRIVHEAYAAIMQKHNRNGYWPDRIVDVRDSQAILRYRKTVAPDAETRTQLTPSVLWWGLDCHPPTSQRDGALPSSVWQLERHVNALVRAAPDTPRIVKAAEIGVAVLGLLTLPVGTLVTGTAGAVLQTIGTAYGLSDSTGHGLAALYERIVAFRSARGPASQDLIDELASRLAAGPKKVSGAQYSATALRAAQLGVSVAELARGSAPLPTILVLEDAHWADELTTAMVRRLIVDRDGAVLVIALTWPRPDRGAEPFMRMVDGLEEELSAESAQYGTRLMKLDVPSLQEQDLRSLIAQTVSGASKAQQDALIHQCSGNPLLLQGLIASDAVREALDDEGRLLLDPEDILQMPKDMEHLFRQLFDELPRESRQALHVASLLGLDFVPGVAEAGLSALGDGDPQVAFKACHDASWLTKMSDYVSGFTEPALYDAANQRSKPALARRTHVDGPRKRDLAVRASAAKLRALSESAHPSLATALKRQQLRLHAEGLPIDDLDSFVGLACSAAESLAFSTGDLRAVKRLMDSARDALQQSHHDQSPLIKMRIEELMLTWRYGDESAREGAIQDMRSVLVRRETDDVDVLEIAARHLVEMKVKERPQADTAELTEVLQSVLLDASDQDSAAACVISFIMTLREMGRREDAVDPVLGSMHSLGLTLGEIFSDSDTWVGVSAYMAALMEEDYVEELDAALHEGVNISRDRGDEEGQQLASVRLYRTYQRWRRKPPEGVVDTIRESSVFRHMIQPSVDELVSAVIKLVRNGNLEAARRSLHDLGAERQAAGGNLKPLFAGLAGRAPYGLETSYLYRLVGPVEALKFVKQHDEYKQSGGLDSRSLVDLYRVSAAHAMVGEFESAKSCLLNSEPLHIRVAEPMARADWNARRDMLAVAVEGLAGIDTSLKIRAFSDELAQKRGARELHRWPVKEFMEACVTGCHEALLLSTIHRILPMLTDTELTPHERYEGQLLALHAATLGYDTFHDSLSVEALSFHNWAMSLIRLAPGGDRQ